MAAIGSVVLDDIDLKILGELHQDSRISLVELSRRVSLSRPAIADRIRRLETAGVILGYGAHLDLARLGLAMQARIRLTPRHRLGRSQLRDRLMAFGSVLSCVHVTGENSYELAIAVRDAQHLSDVVDELSALGSTTTSVVLSEVIHSREIDLTGWIEPARRPSPQPPTG